MADNDIFQKVALPHLNAVYRAAVVVCRNREQAEDLVQTTFLKAFERFETFKPGTNCKAWLLQVLRNTWVDTLRHKRVAGTHVPLEEDLVAGPESQAETVWSDARDLLENFSDEQVIQALRELPDEQRLTLFLADVEQFSHNDIAELMAVAVGTVKSRTSRARAMLKSKLMARAKDLGFVGRGR